ncbi:MAG: ribonuclease HI [Bacteroidetes bacterium]|nr:ribonuclease HI [Bacteroidota bacterium]HET6244171.1 ribonuclease H [Bacteroidia bacterium]
MSPDKILVYTDGSCNTKLQIGAWAAIVIIAFQKVILKDVMLETTHNRMELLAVIKAIDYLESNNLAKGVIQIYSDSQYVINLLQRKEKLKQKGFLTNKGSTIPNLDLIKKLINQMETHTLDFIKVKAHQKQGETINYNREVDKLARKIVRERVNNSKKITEVTKPFKCLTSLKRNE